MRDSSGGIGRNIRRRRKGRKGSGDGFSRSEAKPRNDWGYRWVSAVLSALNSLVSVMCWVWPAVLAAPRNEESVGEYEAPSVYGCGGGEFMGDPVSCEKLGGYEKPGLVTLWGSIVVESAVGDEMECPVPFGLRRNIREYLDMVTLVDGC